MAQFIYSEPSKQPAPAANRAAAMPDTPAFSMMFHDVIENGDWESSGFRGGANSRYKLSRIEFERHLDAICSVVSSKPYMRPALTFDDGGASAYSTTAACLEARGLRGYFLVVTDYVGRPGFVNARELRELHRRGHLIGSHSCSHPDRIANCSRLQIDREWVESVRVLAELVGEPVAVASVPGGFYSRQVAESAAAAGIRRLFTSEPVISVRFVGPCEILGRYTIQRGATPEWSASIAEMRRIPRLRQALLWKLKQLAKAGGGSAYVKLRRKILNP